MSTHLTQHQDSRLGGRHRRAAVFIGTSRLAAMFSASMTNDVVIDRLALQHTRRREKTSMMQAT